MNPSRRSLDSGYHSMIAKPEYGNQNSDSRASTFVTSGMESSPERSPRKLHKAISSTFSGAMQAFSNTVRATTSYIYPTTGEPELPSSEWAECETPKKESRRSSIMSSVRSRKHKFTPRPSGAKTESPEMLPSSVPVKQNGSPALDVKIPNSSLSYESLGKVSVSNGSQLLAGVKLPSGPKNLWPGPTRLTVEQASGGGKQESQHVLSSDVDNPYVEQRVRLQHRSSSITASSRSNSEPTFPELNTCCMSDDKGCLSEVGSNAGTSKADGFSPACLNHITPGLPKARSSSPCRHNNPAASHVHAASTASPSEKMIQSVSILLLGPEAPKPQTLDRAAEQTASVEPPNRRFSRQSSGLEDGLNALSPQHELGIRSKSRALNRRLPSDVYDADAETLESNMGSRAVWEHHRADRERRYMQIVDMASDTESDVEVGPELELKKSPSRKPVHCTEELVQDTVNTRRSKSAQGEANGDLHYAIEAIDRPVFPLGDLAYAVEAIDRPSITTFEPLETVFQQRPMLQLSDMADEPERLQAPHPLALSPSRTDHSSSPIADLSPSRGGLPTSPEPSPVQPLPAHELTMTSTRLTDEENVTFRVGDVEGQSNRQFSSDPTDLPADSSPEHQAHQASENFYETGSHVPSCLSRFSPMENDTGGAGVGGAGNSMPTYSPDVVQTRPVVHNLNEDDIHAYFTFSPIFKGTSRSTYRGKLEAGSTLPKQRSQNGTAFEHSRTVSAFSSDTDDSCATTISSPTQNAPPPFPSLHVRSEPARRISNALDATCGYEKISLFEPANAGISHSLPSPFDDPGNRIDEAGFKFLCRVASEGADSPKMCAQATPLKQHKLQSPSPSSTSSIQTQSNSNTPQKTFNAAESPSFGRPSLIASRKARDKHKKSSSGKGNYSFANRTINATHLGLKRDFSLPKSEPNRNSAPGRAQTLPREFAKVAGEDDQKPSQNRQTSKKYQLSRNQPSLNEFADDLEGSIRGSDLTSKLNSTKRSPCITGQKFATLTPSPPRMKLPRARGEMSYDELRENREFAVKDPKSRHEPEYSIKRFDSMSNVLSLHVSGKVDGISYGGHQMDRIVPEKSSGYFRQPQDNNLQEDKHKKAAKCASGNETTNKDSGSRKNSPRILGRDQIGTSSPDAEMMFAGLRELERKLCSQPASKMKSRALVDDSLCEDGAAHKDGRPPWRP